MPTKLADLFAAAAVGAQPALWVSEVNGYLQLIGSVIGLVAGVYAILHYRTRIEAAKYEQSKRRDTE